MTLVQLQHFVALARAGSFVRASETLHLTQPALSRSIKALEGELGQLLFDRIGRRIELTPFGEETLRRARLLLEDARELRDSGRRGAAGGKGRLRLGLGSGPGAMFNTLLLAHMARTFPEWHLQISRGNTETLARLLRERALDALIVDIRSLKPASDLAIRRVVEADGAFMCRKGHPLLRRQRRRAAKLRFEELLRYPIASTPLSDELARILVERYGERAHPADMVTLASDEITHLVETARQTDAIVLAIRLAALDLVELELDPPLDAKARFGLVTLAGRAQSVLLPEIQRLMDEAMG